MITCGAGPSAASASARPARTPSATRASRPAARGGGGEVVGRGGVGRLEEGGEDQGSQVRKCGKKPVASLRPSMPTIIATGRPSRAAGGSGLAASARAGMRVVGAVEPEVGAARPGHRRPAAPWSAAGSGPATPPARCHDRSASSSMRGSPNCQDRGGGQAGIGGLVRAEQARRRQVQQPITQLHD